MWSPTHDLFGPHDALRSLHFWMFKNEGAARRSLDCQLLSTSRVFKCYPGPCFPPSCVLATAAAEWRPSPWASPLGVFTGPPRCTPVCSLSGSGRHSSLRSPAWARHSEDRFGFPACPDYLTQGGQQFPLEMPGGSRSCPPIIPLVNWQRLADAQRRGDASVCVTPLLPGNRSRGSGRAALPTSPCVLEGRSQPRVPSARCRVPQGHL